MNINDLIKDLDMNKVQEAINTPKGQQILREIERNFTKGKGGR